jgi:propionate catabolism operon transcriptional regulator
MKRDLQRPPASGRPRLCFVGYRHIREFAMPVISEYAGRADIELVDGTFGSALTLARDRIERGAVDAFVSAGSNASILRRELSAPVATIQLTGFDLLEALIRAKRIANRVGMVTFGEVIPQLDAVKELLNIEVTQYAYRTPEEARRCFVRLRDAGFRVIVGSSLVVELANEYGLTGLLAYSLDSIRRGIEDAIELARVARLEASRYERLNGVLHNLQQAVLAVDGEHRITMVNPPMEQLLGRPEAALLGHDLDEVEPDLSLETTLAWGWRSVPPCSGWPSATGSRIERRSASRARSSARSSCCTTHRTSRPRKPSCGSSSAGGNQWPATLSPDWWATVPPSPARCRLRVAMRAPTSRC